MQTIYQETPNRGGAALGSVCQWVDAAGDLFIGWMQAYVDPQNTLYRIRKYHQGQQIGEWTLQPNDRAVKADSGSFTPSGSKLIVTLTAHDGATPRNLTIMVGEIEGVFAPYHAGQFQAGAPGAVLPQGIETGGDGGMKLDVLVAALSNAQSPLSTILDRHIKNNVRVAIEDEHLFNNTTDLSDTGALYHSGGLYQRIKETVYQVLNENGLIHR